ncbi:family 16 glycosylhydrolase [Flavobacterium sp.]|uniref:family 16 glycosylhydrolase n=1 Tax=Flavobacterium sp. TaxID=239 RepID=UPI0026320A10|nr:family 16 glycosylhydrolase [Flavobacterium sp.]
MKRNTHFQVLLLLLMLGQFCRAQVDVVYNDLVWSDEFDTNGPVNSSNWFHQTQLPAGGSWFNGEVQHYTNQQSNSFVDGGFLKIVAKKEPYTDQGVTKQFTSARLNSKFAFKYGRVDVRAKLPMEQGTWPAIWMLGKNVNEDGAYFDADFGTTDWPACGEIDIMEHGIFQGQSPNYIQSTLHTPSSFGNSVNNGGVTIPDLANTYHIYSLNWSPYQLSFLVDGVIHYTYNPAVKDANTWPFDKEQFLLLNIAMGGIAGSIADDFTQTSMDIDYVRVYQNTTLDNERPDNFTAAIGAVTGSSVELLLNATDNSGTVVYNVAYGTQSIFFAGTSGVQKSVIISGLTPNTNYTFAVAVADLTGNTALNNPIVLNTTTSVVLQCGGVSAEASQGSFSTGYHYNFETIGNDVKITFELLDTDRVGVVAYLWKQSPFSETSMTNVSGTIFAKTITGQTIGSTISYAVKFAYAGGLSVTRYFSYVVGSNCSLGIESSSLARQSFSPNPVESLLYLELSDAQNKIMLTDILGQKKMETILKSTDVIDMSDYQSGIYLLKIENDHGIQNIKIIKK